MSSQELISLEGLSAIVEEIVNDVKSSISKVLNEAEQRGLQTLNDAKERAKNIFEEHLNTAKLKAETEKRKIISSAEVEARIGILQARDEIIKRVFNEALIKLKEYVKTDEYYDKCLPRLISEGAKYIKCEKVILHLNKNDMKKFNEQLLRKLSSDIGIDITLSNKPIACVGGVIVESPDGKLSYDNTFEKILRELEPKLRVKLADMLFKEV
ncbi:MAG: hypothetical protein DRJ33_02050 [Candidatus Methanomethylicota archaeon]|uniref:A-type ATP synthase subunit E n=1 Tax=Thermoproteota archaeon TaxID=2056631 RepID=A0A497F181_9CREN|nr:MAG: hypothetical protein DRJ33_02050 [Candidatus Verstraetearchaeota archaeon]